MMTGQLRSATTAACLHSLEASSLRSSSKGARLYSATRRPEDGVGRSRFNTSECQRHNLPSPNSTRRQPPPRLPSRVTSTYSTRQASRTQEAQTASRTRHYPWNQRSDVGWRVFCSGPAGCQPSRRRNHRSQRHLRRALKHTRRPGDGRETRRLGTGREGPPLDLRLRPPQ